VLEGAHLLANLSEAALSERLAKLTLQRHEDVRASLHLRPPTIGQADQCRSPIGRVRRALNVAALLEVVDELSDGLVGYPAASRQLPDAGPSGRRC
jgi:hypothetical protein